MMISTDTGVKNRIHILKIYLDVIIERVHLIKFVVHNILNFKTTRKQPENQIQK